MQNKTKVKPPHTASNNHQHLLEMLFSVFTMSILLTGMAWFVYSKSQHWELMDLKFSDKAVLLGILFNQPLLPLSLALAISWGLLYLKRPILAKSITWGASWVVFIWLGLNLCSLSILGNQLSERIHFLGNDTALEMSGGMNMVYSMIIALIIFTVLIAILIGISKLMVSRLLHHRSAEVKFLSASLAALLYLFFLIAPVLAISSFTRPILILRLTEVLPVSLPLASVKERLAADPTELLREINRGLDSIFPDYAKKLKSAPPADAIKLLGTPKNNIVVIIIESYRHDSLNENQMPKLNEWAKSGLNLSRHYSTTHTSHLGFFACLYGRSPFTYHQTLDAKVPSVLTKTLRNAGYRTTFLAGSDMKWERMNEYLSELNFDEIIFDKQIDSWNWYEQDRGSLRKAEEILTRTSPQLVFIHLNSLHFPYKYPAKFEYYKPVAALTAATSYSVMMNAGKASKEFRQSWINRYHNSLAFTDDIVGNFIEGIDPEKNIIVVTGDHGESFYDDETWLHSSRQSDIQTMVPMVISGAGIPSEKRTDMTSHIDLVPTLLHTLGAKPEALSRLHGRSLLIPRPTDEENTENAILLVNSSVDHFTLLFRNQRLHLKYEAEKEKIYSLGFENPKGSFLPLNNKLSEKPHLWVKVIRQKLEKFVR